MRVTMNQKQYLRNPRSIVQFGLNQNTEEIAPYLITTAPIDTIS